METDSSVSEWYSGQNIFVTGATGFMGKILVEKLLRSAPDVASVYILVREKRGKSASDRLEQFLECPIFDKIKQQDNAKTILDKLKYVNGDVSKSNCDLTDQDVAFLQNTIDVTFHMAANVRFDQSLKSAMQLNVGGTLNVLELCSSFKKLKVFVHVSTSFCHCDEVRIEERLYPSPHDPRQVLSLVNWLDDDVLDYITPKLLKNSPNTYAYTKCLVEQLVSEYAGKMTIAIARPSIVVAALREPIPGWIDNLNGPTGVLVGAGKGVLRTMYCQSDLDIDMIPVDVAVNMIILVAWKTGKQKKTNEVQVFHVTAEQEMKPTWKEVVDTSLEYLHKYPYSVCLWYPDGKPQKNYLVYVVMAFFLHTIPAYLVDFLMVLTKNKPFMLKVQKRIKNGSGMLHYYTTRPWYFHNEKIRDLEKEISPNERKTFDIDMKTDIGEYVKNYVLGARRYCMGEDPSTLPHARKVLKRLYYLRFFVRAVFFGLLFWIFFGYYVENIYEIFLTS